MTQLTIGLYGSEFHRTGNLFGLSCGQMHCGGTHNSGWYNKSGEKLGFGDLTGEDMTRIASGLEEGEIFITLCEGDSYWECKGRGVSESAPGTDYVAEHATFVFTRGHMYMVNDHCRSPARTQRLYDVDFEVITLKEAASLIKTGKF